MVLLQEGDRQRGLALIRRAMDSSREVFPQGKREGPQRSQCLHDYANNPETQGSRQCLVRTPSSSGLILRNPFAIRREKGILQKRNSSY